MKSCLEDNRGKGRKRRKRKKSEQEGGKAGFAFVCKISIITEHEGQLLT